MTEEERAGAHWGPGVLIVDRELWLAEDGKTVVDAGDDAADTLLVEQWGGVPYAKAQELGLDLVGDRVEQV